MGKKATHSRTSIVTIPNDDFVGQKGLSYEETCPFDDVDIETLKSVSALPLGSIFPNILTLSLFYPFLGFVFEFFEITKISYTQVMPTI